MRERRSVNSHEARSIIASARRELRISCSIVSSSTRLSLAPDGWPASTGRSPSRVCVTVPVASAARSSVVMPCSQSGNAPCSVGHQLAPLHRHRRLGDRGGERSRALVDRLHDRRHAAEQPLHI